MDLKEFIEATLSQIVAGVQAAQAGEHGKNVNADAHSTADAFGGGLLVSTAGTFSRVDSTSPRQRHRKRRRADR